MEKTIYNLKGNIGYSALNIIFIILIILTTYFPSFAQWTYQGTVNGVGSNPYISVYGLNEIIVAGGPVGVPKVFKSTNGGTNWTDISGNLNGPELYCVWAINGDFIFVGDGGSIGGNGGNARVWKTTNGGVNWSVIFSTGGTHGFFNDIVFSKTNPLIGIAHSNPPIIYGGLHYLSKTTDGGNTWITQNTISTNGNAVSGTVICIDNLFYGWGVYPPARVVITTDGGSTWNQRNINITGAWATSGFAFSSDKTTGLALSDGSLPYISRSIDGGNTWTSLNTGLPISNLEFSKVKWVYGTNKVFLSAETGASGCIGKSTNAGLNWSVMNTVGVTNLFNIDLIYDGSIVYAYAISIDAKVIKLQEPIGLVTANNNVPSEHKLEQNYPNPFNPISNVKYQISNFGFVTLKVYNVLGKEVVTLVNEQQKPGVYSIEFDGTNYPSGIYYYRLTVSNEQLTEMYRETKKMMLVK